MVDDDDLTKHLNFQLSLSEVSPKAKFINLRRSRVSITLLPSIFTIMRLAIFLCLPIIVYISLLLTSESLKHRAAAYDFHTNSTLTATFIHPYAPPLAGFVTNLIITLLATLQDPRTPEIFIGMLLEADTFINLFAFPPGTSSEFSSL